VQLFESVEVKQWSLLFFFFLFFFLFFFFALIILLCFEFLGFRGSLAWVAWLATSSVAWLKIVAILWVTWLATSSVTWLPILPILLILRVTCLAVLFRGSLGWRLRGLLTWLAIVWVTWLDLALAKESDHL
jgi:hypothetical protein